MQMYVLKSEIGENPLHVGVVGYLDFVSLRFTSNQNSYAALSAAAKTCIACQVPNLCIYMPRWVSPATTPTPTPAIAHPEPD